MSSGSSRRGFLQQTALSGVGLWVAGGISLANSQSPNERLNIASIGVGGKGSSDCDHASKFGIIVALCDCDEKPLDEKAKKFPKAKKYFDFRKMLEEMDKDIDAVTVSTADHTHAPASVMAMKLKKHVYCQKPLTWSVHEARVMRETAEKCKVATQMGNQGTADKGFRRAIEIIRDGVVGPVTDVHVWTNRPIWPQAPQITARPMETPGIPNNVHWYEFLGPAQDRPYSPAYHPFKWRGWWDYGTGALGDMGCHTANMAFMALKLGYPTSVVAECGDLNSETYPSWATVTLQFPARGELPPVKFMWYEGKRDGKKNLPPMELFKGQKATDSGSLLVGGKGILYTPNDYGASYKLLPEKDFEGYQGPSETLPRFSGGNIDENMKAEWVAAIKGGPPAMSNFGYAGMLTEAILLGNAAMRAGKKLDWDGPNMRFTNSPEANYYLGREYRKGWTL